MSSLYVKFQTSSTFDRFWWGVLLFVLLVIVVIGVKQSQHLVLRLGQEFDKNAALFIIYLFNFTILLNLCFWNLS